MLPEFRTRPNKTYCHEYHVRHVDDNAKEPATLEYAVAVNHYRKLFFAAPIAELEARGCIDLTPADRDRVRKGGTRAK
jgi:hypothetical protein